MNRCLYCFGDLHGIVVFCPKCGGLQKPAFYQLINRPVDDRYHVHRGLNQGERSTLYVATDLYKDETVVIKLSDPARLIRQSLSHAMDYERLRHHWAEMIEHMRMETEAMMLIRHPNIGRFYGTGMVNDDIRYTVMECLHGTTLREKLDLKKRLPLTDVIEIMLDISAALRQVHALGIAHRNLHPGNIFLYRGANLNRSQLTARLAGFGIAKFPPLPGLTQFARHPILTPETAYDPPEQYENRFLDHRSDIYSLGAVIYEMLTGKPPFKVGAPDDRTSQNIQTDPIPPSQLNPDAPPHLDQAILRALAKNPDDRQQSIDELRDQLRTGTVPPINFQVWVNPDQANGETNKGYRRGGVAMAIAVTVIAILYGSFLLPDKPLNFIFSPDKKAAISTALPPPSPAPTTTPIEIKVEPDAINAADLSKTTMQPAQPVEQPSAQPPAAQLQVTQQTSEPPIAKPNAQLNSLQSAKNEIGRQEPQPEKKDDKESQPTQSAQSIKAKTLQWSGTVDRERTVKIDMPGVPGKLEVNHTSGCRVEITEPPNAANNWGQVTLRILGQGDVSFRLRWAPI